MCGAQAASEARFCGECGAALETGSTAANETPARQSIVPGRTLTLLLVLMAIAGGAAFWSVRWYLARDVYKDRLLAVLPDDVTYPSSLVVSKDGRDAAYVAILGMNRWVVIHGETRSAEYDMVDGLAFAEDGSGPTFVVRRGGSWFRVHSGREGAAVPGATQYSFPAVSADGRRSWYAKAVPGGFQIVTDGQPGATSPTPPLTARNEALTEFAYVRGPRGQMLVVATGRQFGPFDEVGELVFDGDGRSVVYTARRAGQWAAYREATVLQSGAHKLRLAMKPDGGFLTAWTESPEGPRLANGRLIGGVPIGRVAVGPADNPSFVAESTSGLASVLTSGQWGTGDWPEVSLLGSTDDGQPVFLARAQRDYVIGAGSREFLLPFTPLSSVVVSPAGNRVAFGAVVNREIHWKSLAIADDAPEANGSWFALRKGLTRRGMTLAADGTLSGAGRSLRYRVPSGTDWVWISPASPNGAHRLVGLREDSPSVLLDFTRNVATTLPTTSPIRILSWGPAGRALVSTYYEGYETVFVLDSSSGAVRPMEWPPAVDANESYSIVEDSLQWKTPDTIHLRLEAQCTDYAGTACPQGPRRIKRFAVVLNAETTAIEGQRTDVAVPPGARATVDRFYASALRGDIDDCLALLPEGHLGRIDANELEGTRLFMPLMAALAEKATYRVHRLVVSDDRAAATVIANLPDYKGSAAGRRFGEELMGITMKSVLGGTPEDEKSKEAFKAELAGAVGRLKDALRAEQPAMREVTTTCVLRRQATTWRVEPGCGPEWTSGWAKPFRK
jgi:hypothetical protein